MILIFLLILGSLVKNLVLVQFFRMFLVMVLFVLYVLCRWNMLVLYRNICVFSMLFVFVVMLFLLSVMFRSILIEGLFFICDSSFSVKLGVILGMVVLFSMIFFRNLVLMFVVLVVLGKVLQMKNFREFLWCLLLGVLICVISFLISVLLLMGLGCSLVVLCVLILVRQFVYKFMMIFMSQFWKQLQYCFVIIW